MEPCIEETEAYRSLSDENAGYHEIKLKGLKELCKLLSLHRYEQFYYGQACACFIPTIKLQAS